jgi:hypothetical protein
MKDYDPKNWFWIVGGDTTRAWSSAAGAYVAQYDPERLTSIVSEAELSDVLRRYGLQIPAPTLADYKGALQAHIDAVAHAKDYDSGISLAGYKGSPVAEYADDAAAFLAWRDPLWPFVFQIMAGVQTGVIPQPSIAELIAMLPAPPWAPAA